MTTTHTEHRAAVAAKMHAVSRALNDLYAYWLDHDLPDDFLADDEYPFHRSLDDLTHEVAAAADKIDPHAGMGVPL